MSAIPNIPANTDHAVSSIHLDGKGVHNWLVSLCIPEAVPCSLRLLPPPQSRLNILTEHTTFGEQIPGVGDKSSQRSDCFNLQIVTFYVVMDTNPVRPSWDNSMAIRIDSHRQVGCWKKTKQNQIDPKVYAYTINYHPGWVRKIAITDWTWREGAHTCYPTHCLAAHMSVLSAWLQKVISSPLWGSQKALRWIMEEQSIRGY